MSRRINTLTRIFGGVVVALSLTLLSTSVGAQSYQADVLVDGLSFPVSIQQLPGHDDDFLVVEKFGDVRLVRDGELLESPVASFDVAVQNEGGMLSLALYPDFEETGRFLVSYTPEEPLDKFYVTRLELDGDRARVVDEPFIETPSRPSTDVHYGGNLRFGPNGKLWLGVGELNRREWAQDEENEPGSMLRYNPDGTVPDDNPFGEDNPVWAYGLRNPFDYDISSDGRLFVGDNGADANDEINEVEAGANYGWPLVEGYCDHFPRREPCEDADDFADPVHEFRTIIGPTGVLYYEGDAIPSLQGQLLVGGWHTAAIHRLDVGAPGELLEPAGVLYTAAGDFSFTDVEQGRDGSVLVLAASRDVGRIIRITEAPDDHSPEPQSPETDAADDPGGCSAADGSAPSSTALLAAIVGLLLWRRRRRDDRCCVPSDFR
jgi:MYXO-CTERM domain-containing protein